MRTFANPAVRSVLIEIEEDPASEKNQGMFQAMAAYGFANTDFDAKAERAVATVNVIFRR